MNRGIAVALTCCAFSLAHAQETSFRPQADVEREASWAGHEALNKIQSDGLQGLIAEIKQCYVKSKKPAYRCVYLDVSASVIDEGVAKSLGLPHSYTDDFLNPDTIQDRVAIQYNAAGVSENAANDDLVDALVIASKIIGHDVGKATSGDQAATVDQADQDNLCAQPDIQKELISRYNGAKELTLEHGQLIKVSHLRTSMVSDSDLTCSGEYTFADGTTKSTDFGFSGDFVPPSSQPHRIPRHCKSAVGRLDAIAQIPGVIKVDPSVTSISDVSFLADEPRIVYYPAVNGQRALNFLQCPVRVTWSNGHQDYGYFEEWDDKYDQVQVYFGHDPYTP